MQNNITPRKLAKAISSVELPNTFNPYSQRCEIHDRTQAPQIRRRTLLKLLELATATQVEALWLGRDLGHRGGRRSGMALTDDIHLLEHGARWGMAVARPTKGHLLKERTAEIIWRELKQIDKCVFLWNAFPLHPHDPFNPFSNRAHTTSERKVGEQILLQLIDLIQPKRIVAIGNDALSSAQRVLPAGKIHKVRHPSYGGQSDFVSELRCLYGTKRRAESL